MGNNKQALMLIIERLGDVQRAIEFAKEQKDEDLWEDLLNYSESRPGKSTNEIKLTRRLYSSATRACRIRDQSYPPDPTNPRWLGNSWTKTCSNEDHAS
jgi:hypothetical protein